MEGRFQAERLWNAPSPQEFALPSISNTDHFLCHSIVNHLTAAPESRTSESDCVFLRAEGLLFSLRPFSLPAHFARNAQAFTERVYRLPVVACLGLIRTVVSVESPEFAARLMHLPLRAMSRDRLDL